jgi:NhaP-type Na+/H+ or K+/H+ antiporter
LIFLLMGLQLRSIFGNMQFQSLPVLVMLAVLVSLVVVAVRFAWVFAGDLPGLLRRGEHGRWRTDVALSWAGMRGVVSLAAALALPLATGSGAPFPERELLIFLTMCVILATLVGQGLTLPLVVRLLRLHDDGIDVQEEAVAREAASRAAEDRLEELADAWPNHLPLIDALRAQYSHRASHLVGHDVNGQDNPPTTESDQEIREHRAIRHAVIEAGRAAVLNLRDSGDIGDEVLRTVERELDLEELRMEA